MSRPCVCVCVYWLSSLYTTFLYATFVNIERGTLIPTLDHSYLSLFFLYEFSRSSSAAFFLSRLLMLNVLNPFRCENYCGLVYTVIRYTRYRSFRDYEVVVCERKSYSPHPWNIGRCDIVGYNRGGSRIGRMLWDIGFRYWRVVSG